jgi:hypothetical protein
MDLFRWFKEYRQDVWNCLVVVFTGLLAFCTYQQVRLDTPFLSPDAPQLQTDTGALTVAIRNTGREPSGQGVLDIYQGTLPCGGGNVLSQAQHLRRTFPGIGAGQVLSHFEIQVPDWTTARFEDLKKNCGPIVFLIILKYPHPLWGQLRSATCWQTLNIALTREMGWSICDVDEMLDEFNEWDKEKQPEQNGRPMPPVL